MSNNHHPNDFNTPEIIREREAWYKAGAHAISLFIGLGAVLVGLIVVITSIFIMMSPYESATAVVVGIWGILALGGLYTEASARSKAKRSEVHIERF
jgi:hypothetical protein